MNWKLSRLAAALSILAAPSAWADPFFFSTGAVTNAIGMASRPDLGGKTEIEAADDFVTTAPTTITSATFTGIVTSGTTVSTIGEVDVEIYRVFPADSDATRTPAVPTRTNSPSDVAFAERSSSVAAEMTFASQTLAATFTAANSVLNGIHPAPNQQTMGEGAVSGREVQFTVTFATPLVLPTDHYFFIPQVQVTGGEFYWLSGSRPLVAPGATPFTPDLQAWIRNEALDPDWLRVGTDIIGGTPAPTFNGAFTLTGTVATVPEPETGALMLLGLAAIGGIARRRRAAAIRLRR
jgi:hypothetical protein